MRLCALQQISHPAFALLQSHPCISLHAAHIRHHQGLPSLRGDDLQLSVAPTLGIPFFLLLPLEGLIKVAFKGVEVVLHINRNVVFYVFRGKTG